MGIALSKKFLAATVAVATLSLSSVEAAESTIRIALGDVASVEQLAFLVALERAKERG